jgi:acetyl esterase/lipase
VTASWVFLGLALWGALWTFVAFHPPRRPPLLLAIGFFTAWLTTELAPIQLFVQVVGTAILIAFGALDAWPGWAALAITAVSWVGLIASINGSFGTRRVFEEALDSALPPGWRATASRPRVELARRLEWKRVFMPFHFRRKGVRRLRNLRYVDDDDKRHRLDVYARADVRNAPVLLQIPGGGWMISNKDQQGKPLMYRTAAAGWVCVAINYTLSPKATWPDHLVDCKRALAWVREHIAEYGGDPDYVVVTGGSAGGHLTAMMGLTANEPEWQPGFEDVDTHIRAMVPFYGVYDWIDRLQLRGRDGLTDILERYIVKQSRGEVPDVYEQASPLNHVRTDAPPALVVHGDLDRLALVEEAREFVHRLRAVSHSPTAYVELAGAHHAFEVFNSIRTLETVAGVEEFLTWLLAAYPPGAQVPAVDDRSRSEVADGAAIDLTPTAHTAPSSAPPTRATPGRS